MEHTLEQNSILYQNNHLLITSISNYVETAWVYFDNLDRDLA